MGVFDKLFDLMKLDDEDLDEFDEFEDDEDLDEKPAKTPFFRKKEKEVEYDYDLEDAIVNETKAVTKSAPAKVTPITKKRTGNGMEVCVIKPTTFEDAREVTDTLLSGRAVVLNFEGMDVDLAQRIIDYTCGTCVAIDGNLRKISSYMFIVTPKSVDVSGDLLDLMSDGYEVPGIKTDF